jgi:hypothetical protein
VADVPLACALTATLTQFTAFPLVPALPAVSTAPPREPSSESPSSAQTNSTEPESATGLARRATIAAAGIILPAVVLPQPAVVAADVPAASPLPLATPRVVPSVSAPVAAVRRPATLAPVRQSRRNPRDSNGARALSGGISCSRQCRRQCRLAHGRSKGVEPGLRAARGAANRIRHMPNRRRGSAGRCLV